MILLGDCLDLMKNIPDASVDLILTDPPYGTTACKWDSVIPFEPMWKELKRVRKKNAAICLFGSEPFSSSLRMSNIKEFKYDWVWVKNRPANINCGNIRPMKYHENISVFSLGRERYYKQMIERSESGKKRVRSGIENNNSVWFTAKEHNSTQGRMSLGSYNKFDAAIKNPSDILSFNRDNATVHPTQKPVALLEYLIKTYTLEGEIVLDFTMGSGSTGVACQNLDRKFIGIEKDEKYFEIAKNRLKIPERNL